jgi:hypothetical protein
MKLTSNDVNKDDDDDVEQKDFDVRDIFDAEVGPLLKKMHTICFEHNIPMYAIFAISRDDERLGVAQACMLNKTKDRVVEKINMIQAIADSENSHVRHVELPKELKGVIDDLLGRLTGDHDNGPVDITSAPPTETKH